MKSRGIILLALSTLIVTGCELGGHPVNYSGDTLFSEDFDDYQEGEQPDGWVFVDDPDCYSGPSSWYIRSFYSGPNKTLSQWSEIWGGWDSTSYYGTTAFAGQDDWTDYRFECDFYTVRDDGVGFDFRVDNGVSGSGFYRLFILKDPTNGGPFSKLYKYNSFESTFTELASSPETYEPSVWNTVIIEVVGTHIECQLDNTTLKTLFAVDDNDVTKGKIGLFCYYMKGIDFDNIEITALDENGNEGNRLF